MMQQILKRDNQPFTGWWHGCKQQHCENTKRRSGSTTNTRMKSMYWMKIISWKTFHGCLPALTQFLLESRVRLLSQRSQLALQQHSALSNGTLYSNSGTDIILAVCFVDSFRHALTISRRLMTRLIIHSPGWGENLSKSSTFRNLPYSAGIVRNKSTLMPSPELRNQRSTPLRSQLLCPSLEAEEVPISSLKQWVVADGDDIALYGRSGYWR